VNATIENLDSIPLSEVQGFKALALPWYTDQILPFDVTIAAANEYGAAASSKVFGIEILNEGFGTSIDDSVMEAQATFIARSVSRLLYGRHYSTGDLSSDLWQANQVMGVGRRKNPRARLPPLRINAAALHSFLQGFLRPGRHPHRREICPRW
jgi:hypothetical protein